MSIRDYHPSDHSDCLAAFHTNVPHYFALAEIAQYEQWLDELEKPQDDSFYYVLLTADKLIGAGGFGYDAALNQVILAWGFIAQPYHKKGFGKQLFEYRLEKINQLYPQIPIALDTTQFSYPFFQKYDFEIERFTKDGYAPGMDRYDMKRN